MRQVAIYTIDYVDAATTNILLTNILLVEDLINLLRHIESELPPIMHLPISSGDTSFLLVSQHTHIHSRRRAPASHQCPHTKQRTTSLNI